MTKMWLGGLGLVMLAACGASSDSTFLDGNGAADAATDPGDADPGSSSGSSGTSSGNPFPGDGGPVSPYAADVHALVTSDNAFSFGYGDAAAMSTFIRGAGSHGGAIFDCPVGHGPHAYVVPAASAPAGAYLYIVAWADESTTQGTLAQFQRAGGEPVLSGAGAWEVCAVGEAHDAMGNGPDQAAVTARIAECNEGADTVYSRGWVDVDGAVTEGARGKLARGEANDAAGGDFPLVCQSGEDGSWEEGSQAGDAAVPGMSETARWMWFDPQDDASPFVGNAGNRTQSYLIFRLPASALPPPVN